MSTQGVSFSHFYVDDSLCCPSRASILRGQLVHNTDVLNNQPPTGGFEKFHAKGRERSTVATWLHAAGYRTGLFGKYLNGYPNTVAARYVPPGWDTWVSPSGGNPYAEYHYQLNDNGNLVQYGHQPADYLVDVLSHKATDYIHASAGKQPFFAYIAPLCAPRARHTGTALRQRVPQRDRATHPVVRPTREQGRPVLPASPPAALPRCARLHRRPLPATPTRHAQHRRHAAQRRHRSNKPVSSTTPTSS